MQINATDTARRIVHRLRMEFGQRVRLIRVGVGLVLIAVLAIGLTVWDLRRITLAEALVATDNLAIVLAAQTGRSVQSVDIVLRDVQERIAALGVTTPEQFNRVLRTQEMHGFLRSRVDRLPQVDSIFLIGADGARVSSSVGWPPPDGNLSDRDYVRHFAMQDDPDLFISEAVVNRVSGGWVVFLARRVNGPHGAFLGVVLGSVPLKVFHDLFQSINLPPSESLMLLRRDGTVLARHPDPIDRAGAKMPADSPWYAEVTRGGGYYHSLGVFDSEKRLVAVRLLPDYPLVMDAALSEPAALAGWRRETMLIGIGTVCAAACLLLLLRALGRQFQQLQTQQGLLATRNTELTRSTAALQRTTHELRASEAHLVAVSSELNITLASMDQGLVMVDAAGSVAVCNRRAIELLDLPAELMASRPSFDIVAPLQLLTDGFEGANGPTAECTANTPTPTQVAKPSPAYERELPNGRIVEVHSGKLAGGGGWMATFEDITARRHAEEQVVFMARHDALTLLPNRTVFRERVETAVAHANRATAAAVLYLDLDHFKGVNDTLGHPVGDALLRQAAARLSACVRRLDTVARFGGDEFGVVQVGPDRVEDVAMLAQRIIDQLSLPYEVEGHQVIIGVSLGIAMACADGSDPDTLLKNADIALYRAKAEGRGVFRFFAPEMDARLQERRKLELELHAALLNNEFELYYQPQLDLATNRICGFEALMRWNHPTRGVVNPYEFIWLTEEMGLIVPLGEWALRQACREAMQWPFDVRVAVNLSPVQFNRHDLIRNVREALDESGLPPQRLDLEITETVLLLHNADNLGILRELRELGVRISMDDFGTGYSSLSYLRSFPFDKIKIDQSFIRDLPHDKDAAAIVRAITALGASLGMVTVAEGVERPDQLARLREEGCAEVQGYLFSVPQPASNIPELLRRFHASESQAA
ncbi:MAG TPA: EAL domain-containing protein [Acetobacteraceae bacterium]|jgi:diguanylate cyclase (GGDEF)-like protein